METSKLTQVQSGRLLLSQEASRSLDEQAHQEWGFNPFALIEAAGRLCAERFLRSYPEIFTKAKNTRITVAAGSGANAADCLTMLRYWILSNLVSPSNAAVILTRPDCVLGDSPNAQLLKSMRKLGVKVLEWNGELSGSSMPEASREAVSLFESACVIIDGIAGTGLNGALKGAALEMANAINAIQKPFVLSVDVPSGNFDGWEAGMPIIKACATLSIQPQKLCLYVPAARPFAGEILPVSGVFPEELTCKQTGYELLDWETAQTRITKIRPDTFKNQRGLVEIRAGSPGITGAALIAAKGAQAAGAGLVRIVSDDEVYPILASQVTGIMVKPESKAKTIDLAADAVLLGPGWGKELDRKPVVENALLQEKKGVPLILDADAIALVKDKIFSGYAILTPHPGELSAFSGIAKEKLLSNSGDLILKLARERNAVILSKGHVIMIAAPDGRLGIVDGMKPVLAAGGSGDLLAGLCAGIAARMAQENRYCGFDCACIAATLLTESACTRRFGKQFTDPIELATRTALLAGEAWLGTECSRLENKRETHDR